MKTMLVDVASTHIIANFIIVSAVFTAYCDGAFNPFPALARRPEKHELPVLGFAKKDLEPYIDTATVEAHYNGHHATYTNKLNAALAEAGKEQKILRYPILYMLMSLSEVPEKSRTAIRNQGGGYLNHCIYWACMTPNPSGAAREPIGQLARDIEQTFDSFEKFRSSFTDKAVSLFGSGYVWLSRDFEHKLHITTTINQDSPISEGLKPILVLDVWEHAYYLKHQFRRPNHIADWWSVVDWDAVSVMDTWWDTWQDRRDEL